MKLTKIAFLLLAMLIFINSLSAQVRPPEKQGDAIEKGVSTVGVTTLDPAGQPLAYVYLGSPQEATLENRTFSVHLKPAAAAAPGTFSFQGTIARADSPATATALIDRAVRLGQDRAKLEKSIRFLYRMAKHPDYLNSIHDPRQAGDPPHPDDPPQPGEPPIGQQAVMILARSTSDPELASFLRTTSGSSPGIALLYGRAWAGALPAKGQMATLEIRLRENGADGSVIGRLELKAGIPVMLPAPSAPVQVPDRTLAGHLAIGLRWGSPPDLRRLSLLGYGFRVYRVASEFASQSGMTGNTPPNIATLDGLVTAMPDKVILLTEGMILPPKTFTEANAADFIADPKTTFTVDRNQRCCTGTGQLPRDFNNEEDFHYFAVALDLLSQPGGVSLAGYGKACYTAPPLTPADLAVEVDTTATSPKIKLTWKHVRGKKTPPTAYEILRGVSAPAANSPADPRISAANKINNGMHLEMRDPALLVPFKTVAVNPTLGDNPTVVLSGTDGSPFIAPGETCWYAVRAIHAGECGTLHSDPTAAAYASLRRTDAPAAPQLCYAGFGFPFAVVRFKEQVTESAANNPRDTIIGLRCEVENDGISHVKFEIHDSRSGNLMSVWEETVYFPPYSLSSNFVEITATIPGVKLGKVEIFCTVYSKSGAVSRRIRVTPRDDAVSTATNYQRLVFVAGAFSVNNPPTTASFLRPAVISGTPVTSTPVKIGANELTLAKFFLPAPPPGISSQAVSLERLSGGRWRPIGGARVSPNGTVIIPSGLVNPVRATLLNIDSPQGCAGTAHQADGPSGSRAPVVLGICLDEFANPKPTEYRIYRQVGGGSLDLVGQGKADASQGIAGFVDNSVPTVSTEIRYFAQLVDTNGNASPMSVLTTCPVKIISPPPTPVLLAVRPQGISEMEISWSCPAPGIERFQIFVETQKGPQGFSVINLPASILGGYVSAILGGNGPSLPSAGNLSPVITQGSFSQLTTTVGQTAKRYMNTQSYYTPRVAADGPPDLTIGPGPVYFIKLPIPPVGTYKIWVKAIGNTGATSAISNIMEYKWSPPRTTTPGPEPILDWPARALPAAIPGTGFTVPVEVIAIPLSSASGLPNTLFPENTNRRYLRGVVIGQTPITGSKDYTFQQSPRKLTISGIDQLGGRSNPNEFLARPSDSLGETILPAVLYRRQIPNTTFPQPAGDVIQVSPMIENIASYRENSSNVVIDPFVATIEATSDGVFVFNQRSYLSFAIIDSQPLIEGARYQYFLVRFDGLGEMKEVIEAGSTTIPETP